jgi:hypothetical protein
VEPELEPSNGSVDEDGHYSAPDIAENEGMVTGPKPKQPPRPRQRRRHGRR